MRYIRHMNFDAHASVIYLYGALAHKDYRHVEAECHLETLREWQVVHGREQMAWDEWQQAQDDWDLVTEAWHVAMIGERKKIAKREADAWEQWCKDNVRTSFTAKVLWPNDNWCLPDGRRVSVGPQEIGHYVSRIQDQLSNGHIISVKNALNEMIGIVVDGRYFNGWVQVVIECLEKDVPPKPYGHGVNIRWDIVDCIGKLWPGPSITEIWLFPREQLAKVRSRQVPRTSGLEDLKRSLGEFPKQDLRFTGEGRFIDWQAEFAKKWMEEIVAPCKKLRSYETKVRSYWSSLFRERDRWDKQLKDGKTEMYTPRFRSGRGRGRVTINRGYLDGSHVHVIISRPK